MEIPDELQKTVEAVLERLGEDAETIEARMSSTIEPRSRAVDTGAERALGLLSELDGAATLSRRLELHETIGEGGMGVVRVGTQRTLGRKVAVKTLKDGAKSERATVKLLREAWVTGSLEHPNVVPVYDVALEADGSPLIVLKKIEGTGWESLMHDAPAVQARLREDDLLEWNLRVLLQVCNAVHFAHSRGVLHRDLKPENVMVGEFGEVYLVDWGIAVSLRDDGSGRLPLASNAVEMAGTPVYMAPEMLGGRTSRLSERTDVYLLGAVLYEIVVGRPPHQGDALMALVAQIIDSNPEIPPEVPEELRVVIRRAMDPDPDGRFETAEQLRIALQGFLQHRDASALAVKAEARLEELEERIAAIAEGDAFEDREPIYHCFGECRFAYRHALEIWPECGAAQRGLTRAITAMVEYELGEGEPEAAKTLLGELTSAPQELVARVEAAREARREEDAKLRAIHEDSDPTTGRRTRGFLAIVVGSIWCVTPLAMEAVVWSGHPLQPSHLLPLIFDGTVLALITGLGIWARQSMMRTRVNRVLASAVFLAMLSGFLMHGVEYVVGGADPQVTFRHQFITWAAIVALCAPAIDWRLLLPAGVYAAGYVGLTLLPSATFIVLAACNEILLITMVILWFRREDLTAFNERSKQRRAERHRWLRDRIRGDRIDDTRG